MKKTYVKPEIEFVNFRMSANIAACDIPITSEDGWGEIISTDSNTCAMEMDGKCYHVPTPGSIIFGS